MYKGFEDSELHNMTLNILSVTDGYATILQTKQPAGINLLMHQIALYGRFSCPLRLVDQLVVDMDITKSTQFIMLIYHTFSAPQKRLLLKDPFHQHILR